MAPKKDPEMENLKKELTGLAEKCREKQKVGIYFPCVDFLLQLLVVLDLIGPFLNSCLAGRDKYLAFWPGFFDQYPAFIILFIPTLTNAVSCL